MWINAIRSLPMADRTKSAAYPVPVETCFAHFLERMNPARARRGPPGGDNRRDFEGADGQGQNVRLRLPGLSGQELPGGQVHAACLVAARR